MSTEIGKRAEAAAAAYLQQHDFTLLAKNWRTRWCEIDVIAQRRRTIYFVEVKYRHNNLYGAGLDYITAKKLQQMHFAAEMWLHSNGSANLDYRLGAIEVSGVDYTVTQWLDDL